jgi:hypothetical protein
MIPMASVRSQSQDIIFLTRSLPVVPGHAKAVSSEGVRFIP